MSSSVGSELVWAIKPQPNRNKAVLSAARSRHLAAVGVQTPELEVDLTASSVRYRWIEGEEGREVWGMMDARHGADRREFLRLVMNTLAVLHKATSDPLQLVQLDPWKRIRPRLDRAGREGADPTFLSTAARTMAQLETKLPSPVSAVVHGDFHLGQLILERSSGMVWILDLDDLALGDPESDLGNFAAHLASSIPRRDVYAAYRKAENHVLDAYPQATGLSSDRIRFYGAAALLRRALKGREIGWPAARAVAVMSSARTAAEAVAGGIQ